MTASISLAVMGVLDCLSDPGFILVPSVCLENCPFHPIFSVLLSIVFCNRKL
ncbi:Uncharacterised protein [Chlamydia abortus]|nr:Uncharacterised protein [Chlamydia trachomatis]SFW06096.1 Uncharacterised protein [Chlamydia abortus]SGA31562.1 Uncharacterised protein [Chlamydia abortus]